MADLQCACTVYGITTNYARWHFAKHLDTHTKVDVMDLKLSQDDGDDDEIPSREGIAEPARKPPCWH